MELDMLFINEKVLNKSLLRISYRHLT